MEDADCECCVLQVSAAGLFTFRHGNRPVGAGGFLRVSCWFGFEVASQGKFWYRQQEWTYKANPVHAQVLRGRRIVSNQPRGIASSTRRVPYVPIFIGFGAQAVVLVNSGQ